MLYQGSEGRYQTTRYIQVAKSGYMYSYTVIQTDQLLEIDSECITASV